MITCHHFNHHKYLLRKFRIVQSDAKIENFIASSIDKLRIINSLLNDDKVKFNVNKNV